jgi:hypothetical protein
MVHFSCDLCGRTIPRERYEAKIVLSVAFDPEEITSEDLDADNLALVADSLAELSDTGEFELDQTGPKEFHFDLCAHCARKFAQDPLARKTARQLNFSQN